MVVTILRVVLFLFVWTAIANDSCSELYYKVLDTKSSKARKASIYAKNFNHDLVFDSMKSMNSEERLNFLTLLKNEIKNDEQFVNNFTHILNESVKRDFVSFNSAKSLFTEFDVGNFTFAVNLGEKRFTSFLKVSPEKEKIIRNLLSESRLPKEVLEDLKNKFRSSVLSETEISTAIKNGMRLETQFEAEITGEYLDFLSIQNASKRKSGIANIKNIYNKNFIPNAYKPGMLRSLDEEFLIIRQKSEAYHGKRVDENLRVILLENNPELKKEVTELYSQMNRFSKNKNLQIEKAIEEKFAKENIPPGAKERAYRQAKEESEIYRNMRNGCSSGKSNPRLDKAKKKFARFKMGLGFVTTPYFYWMKNKDKLGEDPDWWTKLGWEWSITMAFTFVGSKIMTNSNTSIMGKYWEGLWKFAAIDIVNTSGYQYFANRDGFVKLRRSGVGTFLMEDMLGYPPSERKTKLENEYERIISSPDFDQQIKLLVGRIEAHQDDLNFKNLLDDWFSLAPDINSIDTDKLTLEDLQSEEGKEMLMEMLAEDIYLKNMGTGMPVNNFALMQSGSEGVDRWMFNRLKAFPTDAKRVAIDMAIFKLMCHEPFGPVGTFGAALAITFADRYLFGDLTYSLRREWINQ